VAVTAADACGVPYISAKESFMYEWMFKKEERDDRLKDQRDQDLKAWLLIGAIFVGTLLVVWLPVVIAAMHAA
jgi:hypothetical protein